MVEFSVTLTDQEYTAELSDPNSPQYQQLAAKFQLQVRSLSEHWNLGFIPCIDSYHEATSTMKKD